MGSSVLSVTVVGLTGMCLLVATAGCTTSKGSPGSPASEEDSGEDRLSTLNQLVDCPLPEEVAASAVYGSLHRCEDYSLEGDHNPCDSSARDADDWSILVGLSANAAIEDSESATICYDQEWRDEMEGQTNPGWLYRFAYAAEVLQPGMQIQVWQVDLAGCHGSPRVVELDENGTATLALSASIYCE